VAGVEISSEFSVTMVTSQLFRSSNFSDEPISTLFVAAAGVALDDAFVAGESVRRAYWTPDEPREAAISLADECAWRSGAPELGARKFLEKPPLSYWMTAASFRLFGQSPAASRVPNLLYALLATVAIGLLRDPRGSAAG